MSPVHFTSSDLDVGVEFLRTGAEHLDAGVALTGVTIVLLLRAVLRRAAGP